MFRFHRAAMLRRAELELLDSFWIEVPDNELCHFALPLFMIKMKHAINDNMLWNAVNKRPYGHVP